MRHWPTIPASALAVLAASASAQESIDEVVVTADFTESRLMQRPGSVTVVDEGVIRDRAADHLEDVLALSPNVDYSSGASRARFVQIRGVGDLEQFVDPKHYPSVGITIDDIDLGEIDAARRIDQLVTGGTLQVPFAIDYRSDASFSDLSAQWMPGERLSLGGNLRRYENRGSFPIDRDDWRAFLRIMVAADYAIEIDYRSIDYVEDSFDDYEADILEVAVRLNF